MSAVTIGPATTVPTSTRAVARRPLRTAALIVLFVVITGTLIAVLTGGEARQGAALDPTNPDPGGAKALATVLAQQGVEVIVVRSAADLEAQPIDADTDVVVTSASELGNSTAERLRTHARPGNLIVVEPSVLTATALGVDAEPYGVSIDGPR